VGIAGSARRRRASALRAAAVEHKARGRTGVKLRLDRGELQSATQQNKPSAKSIAGFLSCERKMLAHCWLQQRAKYVPYKYVP
jgi:hypothetical protein